MRVAWHRVTHIFREISTLDFTGIKKNTFVYVHCVRTAVREFDVLHCRVLLGFAPITVKNKIHTAQMKPSITYRPIVFDV